MNTTKNRLSQLLIRDATAIMKSIEKLDKDGSELEAVVSILTSYQKVLTKKENYVSGINSQGTLSYTLETFRSK